MLLKRRFCFYRTALVAYSDIFCISDIVSIIRAVICHIFLDSCPCHKATTTSKVSSNTFKVSSASTTGLAGDCSDWIAIFGCIKVLWWIKVLSSSFLIGIAVWCTFWKKTVLSKHVILSIHLILRVAICVVVENVWFWGYLINLSTVGAFSRKISTSQCKFLTSQSKTWCSASIDPRSRNFIDKRELATRVLHCFALF